MTCVVVNPGGAWYDEMLLSGNIIIVIDRTDEALDPYQGVALHTVSVCDLAKPEFDCESTAVMGAPGRVF